MPENANDGLWIELYSMSGFSKTTQVAGWMRQAFKTTGRKSLYVDFDGSAPDIPQRETFCEVFDPTPPAGTTEEASVARVDAFERRALEAILKAKSMQPRPPFFVADTVSNFGRSILLNLPRGAYKEGGTDRRPWYGEAQTRVLQWAMRMPELQRLGIHVVWVCHEVPPSDSGAKGGPEVVSAGLVKTVPGFARMVLRIDTFPLGAVGTGLIIKGASDNLYLAKDRLNVIPSAGLPITVMRTGADGKDKEPADFEEECLQMGEKVWRTIEKARLRRSGGGGVTTSTTTAKTNNGQAAT